MNITQLETKRRAAQRQIDQLQAPARAAEAAAAELEALEQQIADARQQEAEEQRTREQRENALVGTAAEHALLLDPGRIGKLTVEDAARRWYGIRQKRAELGVPDLGDVVISLKYIATLLVEQDQRAYQIMRQGETRGHGTPAQAEAGQQYQALVERLHVHARPWSEAEALAARVERGDLTEEQALESAGKANEHAFQF